MGLFALHFAVLLFGGSALFAKMLSGSVTAMIFARTFFASLALGLTQLRQIKQTKLQPVVLGCGFLLAGHWIYFFKAIHISNVAVGLMGFSSYPIFIILFEPFMFKEKRYLSDILAATTIALGLSIISPPSEWGGNVTLGLSYGIISGLIFALLTLFNKGFTKNIAPGVLAFWQNVVAMLALIPLQEWPLSFSMQDWLGLVLLGTVFTALSHTCFLYSLQFVKARLAAITIALEPVYGIILAAILLNEWPSPRVFLGSSVIIIATVGATFWRGLTQAKSFEF